MKGFEQRDCPDFSGESSVTKKGAEESEKQFDPNHGMEPLCRLRKMQRRFFSKLSEEEPEFWASKD